MHAIRTDRELAREISKHNISNAFDGLPLADAFQGIIGLTPQEMLHMMGCGMFKYLILGVKNFIGIGANGENSRVKGLVNQHCQGMPKRTYAACPIELVCSMLPV